MTIDSLFEDLFTNMIIFEIYLRYTPEDALLQMQPVIINSYVVYEKLKFLWHLFIKRHLELCKGGLLG